MIGYGRRPDFELYAPDQWSHEQRIAHVMKHNPVLREAQKKEGLNPDKIPEPESLEGLQNVAVKSKL